MNATETSDRIDPGLAAWERWNIISRWNKTGKRNPARVAALRDVLRNDPNSIIRHDAAFLLGDWYVDEAIEDFILALRDDPSFLVRHEVLESLAFLKSTPKYEADIRRALEDSQPDVRATARMTLGHLSARPVRATSAQLLDLEAPVYVRWAAAFVLFKEMRENWKQEGLDALVTCLRDDPDPFMRHVGAFMLDEIGGLNARDILGDSALNDPSLLVRHEAAETLGLLRATSRSLEILGKLVDDDVPEIRATALLALDLIKHRGDSVVN